MSIIQHRDNVITLHCRRWQRVQPIFSNNQTLLRGNDGLSSVYYIATDQLRSSGLFYKVWSITRSVNSCSWYDSLVFVLYSTFPTTSWNLKEYFVRKVSKYLQLFLALLYDTWVVISLYRLLMIYISWNINFNYQ